MIGRDVKFNDPGYTSPEMTNSPKARAPKRKSTPSRRSKFTEIQESVEELEGSYTGDSPYQSYGQTPVQPEHGSGSYEDTEEHQNLNGSSQDNSPSGYQDEQVTEQDQDEEETYEDQAMPHNEQETANATFGDDLDIDLDTPSPDLAYHRRKDIPEDDHYESPSFAQDIEPQDSLQISPGSDNKDMENSPTNIDQGVVEQPID